MSGRSCGVLAAAAAATLMSASPANGQVQVQLNWLFPAEVVYVADFNPFSPGTAPDLLGITLQNTSAGAQNIELALTIRMVEPRSFLIFQGRTETFTMEEPLRHLTNRDLVSTDRDVSMTDFEIGRRAEEVGDQLAQSGRFPAGIYRFIVEVRTPQGIVVDRAQVDQQLTAPSRIELTAPGRRFGDPPPLVTSPAPRFLWSTDSGLVLGDSQYRLRVVPVDDDASPEAAMQGFAAWEHATTTTTALYPGSVDALPLEPGGLYAWQVTRDIRTSGGVEELESPIYWFRMGGGERGTSPAEEAVTRLLEELAALLGLQDELDDFVPTGPITVDGRSVSMEDLQRLLQAILDGTVPVGSVTVR